MRCTEDYRARAALPELPVMTPKSDIIERGWPFASPLPPRLEHPVLAIGNFDGVHLGHGAVLKEAQRLAQRLGRKLVALTFEPHPRSFFRPEEPVFRLTPLHEKAMALAMAGADATLALRFDASVAGLSAEAFVDELLVRACGAAGVVVGHDFHFGKGRAGTAEMLQERLESLGVACAIVTPHLLAGELVSSRAIRAALAKGDVAIAAALLGRPWQVTASVEHGDKRGRELGFPTANLHLSPETGLRHGIYAVRAMVDGKTHNAIASFGRRPTFDDGRPKLEVMLFDFAGDLYGKPLSVDLIAWIRGEERFDSIKALVAQMNRDCALARQLLEAAA
jgi:riboflavin kinase / FMN adenylyltransferase